MKKFLIGACLFSIITVPAMAADTYTGGMVKSLNQKINKAAAPVVNKEKEIKQQEAALKQREKNAQELKQKQIDARKKQIKANQKAQQNAVAKKKQQVQAQKDLLKKEKEDIKSIFTIK